MSETAPKITKDSDEYFSFRRIGGIDQVILKNDWEWQNLDRLDPKIWMALSCPIHGLEFNQATLALLDGDKDGRIRSNDILQAVAWICQRLRHPAILSEGITEVSLKNLRDDTPEGLALISALRLVQEKHEKKETDVLQLAEVEEVIAEAASYPFNGDGVVPPDSAPAEEDQTPDKNMGSYIKYAMDITGAKKDASGKPGLDEKLNEEFLKRLSEIRTWRKMLSSAHLPLGEKTGEAWELMTLLAPKINDYFYRCNLAEYAPEALAAINGDQILQNMGVIGESGHFVEATPEVIESLPLARIKPIKYLNLEDGLNPAYAEKMRLFCQYASVLLNRPGETLKTISQKDWEQISQSFAEYSSLLEHKPHYAAAPEGAEIQELPGFPSLALASADDSLDRAYVPIAPDTALGALSDAQIEAMLSENAQNAFTNLLKKDLQAPPLASFQDLRKMALFHAYLYTFLRNFLSFLDFYEPGKKAIFQSGTLYLDSRGCHLCVPVEDVDAHAKLAAQSHLCLIYCGCDRVAQDGAKQSQIISAALTLGNLVSLIDGRHGLFIDNDGLEWDTRILRIVHNPISIREAVWAPYVRLANMVGEQVQKFIAAKDKAVADASANVAAKVAEKPAEQPKPAFDFAKGAGIFAALSVALSVLSAAFAYIANSVASLGWWWPLAIIGIFLCISGPSVIIAWFKLRKRSLGPLLDASGWAVNQGAPINLVMGASLTTVGKLPKNAIRNLDDPYSLPARLKSRRRWIRFWLIIIALLLVTCCGFFCYWYFYGIPAWLLSLKSLMVK